MIRDASTILRCDDDGLCRVIWVVVPIIIRLFRVPKKGPYFGQPPRCISASVTMHHRPKGPRKNRAGRTLSCKPPLPQPSHEWHLLTNRASL